MPRSMWETVTYTQDLGVEMVANKIRKFVIKYEEFRFKITSIYR